MNHEVKEWTREELMSLFEDRLKILATFTKGSNDIWKKIDELETKLNSYLNQTASDARVDDCFAYLKKLEEDIRQLRETIQLWQVPFRLEALEK